MTGPGYPSDSIVDSRRLTGPNLFSTQVGAVIEVAGERAASPVLRERWAQLVRVLCLDLGWEAPETRVRLSASVASCFMSAPVDLLMTATDVNEHAWALAEREEAPDALTVEQLRSRARAERASRPNLADVRRVALERGLAFSLDDEVVTVGSGARSGSWPLAELPAISRLPWSALGDVPTALVTGSNGKTTTVRLLAAMWAAAGELPGWCCSDGVWIGRERRETGDFSGPGGARLVLRDARVTAAVLETARGGILRRGLATTRADAAIITNISADHFGEYGIDSLHDLADAKSVVADALGPAGTLVLNADDPFLLEVAARLGGRIAWFAITESNPVVSASIAGGGAAAFLRGEHLVLQLSDGPHRLGRVADMPLTLGGTATHNIANVLGAALLAASLGIPLDVVRQVVASFGSTDRDNPGRLHVMAVGGATVLLDYAHNPDGLAALCTTAAAMPAGRRLLVLGQAGNRGDSEVRDLAQAALAVTWFDHVIVKELPTMLRGRNEGELPRILTSELRRLGLGETQVTAAYGEVAAIRAALAWARAGDLLVCPMHAERDAVQTWLEMLVATGWRAGEALPG